MTFLLEIKLLFTDENKQINIYVYLFAVIQT